MVRPDGIDQLEKELGDVIAKKQEAVAAAEFEKAAELFKQEKAIQAERQSRMDAWKKECEEHRVDITVEHIREVISSMTGVPLTRMEEGEAANLLHMEEKLNGEVIGQKPAVSTISRALRRSRAELKDPRRPIGSFIFLGPTGIGKTYLAKKLAEFMFGDPDALIRLDMSEYMEKFNVSRLVGSPPGYVGYDEGGQLTERVRRRPYSVVLFDEIEKAHPDVSNMLLQILEEGELTDSLGNRISFRNTIVIMTSNVGARLIGKPLNMGFGGRGTTPENEAYEKMSERLMESAKEQFRPEFLNRVDEVVIFRMLDQNDLNEIVSLEIGKIASRLKQRGGTLELAPAAVKLLVEKGFKPEYGARQLRRTVERYVEDPLEELLLTNVPNAPFTVVGEAGEDKIEFHLS
jgi:ATP-dependent Clp protease ATP-binding subunit ClpC